MWLHATIRGSYDLPLGYRSFSRHEAGQLRKRLRARKKTLAGRSASRRMK
jgi:hypothetical protein